MGQKPPAEPGKDRHIGCPFCTIQIPAESTVCPHCRNPVSSRGTGGEKPARRILPSVGGLSSGFWDRYAIWIKVAGPVLLAVIVLFFVYQKWTGIRVTVAANRDLPVRVEKERKGNTVVIRGTVTNEGEDVPDLSLRSIRVLVEFQYRDGRRDRKTVFPKSQYRGEGALLRGETGAFEIVAPSDRLDGVSLKTEVVDLGLGQHLIPSRQRGIPSTGR